MKKQLLALALLSLSLFASQTIYAQAYAKGDKDINLGIGLFPTFYGSGYRIGLPPVSASFELGISDEIGVGGILGFSTARTKKYNYLSGEYWWRYSSILAGVRAAYHFNLEEMEKFDLYVGGVGGARIGVASFNSTDPNLDEDLFDTDNASGILYGVFGGGRYQATDKLRVFGELGYGMSYITFGLNFKLASGGK